MMDNMHNECNHTNCTASTTNRSVCQTLTEMDWERGIWNAAFNGEIERVQSIVDKSRDPKVIVNTPDNSGYTALHYSASRGHLDICKMLLLNGANINAQTHGLASPLHKSAAAGKLEIIQFLIKSGANIKMQDIDGETALHKAVGNKHYHIVEMLLQVFPQLKDIKDNRGLIAVEK